MNEYNKPNNKELTIAAIIMVVMAFVSRIFVEKIQLKIRTDADYIDRINDFIFENFGMELTFQSVFEGIAIALISFIIFGIYWARKRHFYQGLSFLIIPGVLSLFILWGVLKI